MPANRRVVFVGGLGWVNGVEQAAAMRRRGLSVTKVCPAPDSAGGRFDLLLDRLVFDDVWPELTDLDDSLDGALADRILDQPTVDVAAVDLVGVALARRRKQEHRSTPRSLPDPLWYDKRRLAERLEALGIPGPRTWDSPVSDTFPVMVKVPVTTSGKGVRLCRDEAEMTAAWSELGGAAAGAFLQEYVDSPIVSVIGVAVDGQVLLHCIYEDVKSPGDPLGPSAQQMVVDRPEAARMAATLVQAVGHSGVFGMNLVVDPQGRYRIIDLNPRIPGSWTSLMVEGLPLLDAYLDSMDGQTSVHYRSLPAGTVGTTLAFNPPTGTGRQLTEWLRATEALLMRRRALGWRFQVWAHARLAGEVVRSLLSVSRARRRGRSGATHADGQSGTLPSPTGAARHG